MFDVLPDKRHWLNSNSFFDDSVAQTELSCCDDKVVGLLQRINC
jgi:hypothetical protein